jgi:hypothetical protein
MTTKCPSVERPITTTSLPLFLMTLTCCQKSQTIFNLYFLEFREVFV